MKTMADILTELLAQFSNDLVIFGLIGVLIGVFARTAWPYLRKVKIPTDGEWNITVFDNKFLYLAVSALATSATFYLSVAPLVDNILIETLLGTLLGFAGNDIFNEIWKTIDNLRTRST